MSSPTIIQNIRSAFQNHLLPCVPKRWSKLFDFGFKAFALRVFTSAGGNARKVVENPNTASTKVDRLLKNLKLAKHFGTIFDSLQPNERHWH